MKCTDYLRLTPGVASNFSVPKQRKQTIQIQTFKRTISDTSAIICSRKPRNILLNDNTDTEKPCLNIK